MKVLENSKIAKAIGFGSISDVPRLPYGFADVFQSYLVDSGGVRLHAVIGGSGNPLLLLAGWPQNWFAWRYLMLPLAQNFTVIAVDPRGVGLSEKPTSGYDSDSLSADMFALMDTLGHGRFAMVGHDIGEWTGYAMAVDRPERIERIALGEAIIPGVSDSPPLLSVDRHTSDFLWHFNFNRALRINEQLVQGREEIYFGYQFATKGGSPDALPAYAREFYIEQLKRDPTALRASFDYYRALDQSIPQFQRRSAGPKIAMPVFSFEGELSGGGIVERELRSVAENVQSLMILGSGHYPAEDQPRALLDPLQGFLEPYRRAL